MSPNPGVEKAIVVLSGGLDSTVTLATALERYDVVLALTFNYGQRAYGKEIRASRLITDHFGVKHQIVPLPWLASLLPEAMQVKPAIGNPVSQSLWQTKSYQDPQFYDAKAVWVPNRNGLFLNIAATYAEAYEANVILFGANADEGERFPDNTPSFREVLTESLRHSTLSHPRIESPLEDLSKADIISKAQTLHAPLHLIWSCYGDADSHCGKCPSCVRLKTAFTQHSKTKSKLPIQFMSEASVS